MSKRSSSTRRPAPRPKTARKPPVHPIRVPHLSPILQQIASQHELTTKRRGELAELAFTLKAASLGFGVAKPYGDSERYDFILDSRDLTNTCHPEERAFCATKDPGVPRHASCSLRGTNARLARILCPTTPTPPLHRIQVKCSTQLLNGLYRANAHRRS